MIQQQNSRINNAALNETLSSVHIGLANFTLTNNGAANYGLNAESEIVLNYPFTINQQPLLVNYYARTPLQAQYPAIYYYFPSVSNVHPQQYVLINTQQQQTPNENIQVNSVSAAANNLHRSNLPYGIVDRELFEKYNISFNDAL